MHIDSCGINLFILYNSIENGARNNNLMWTCELGLVPLYNI